MESMSNEATSEDVREEVMDMTETEGTEATAEQATYSDPDDYREKTGKRFRMTKAQKERGLNREEAFAEFAGGMVVDVTSSSAAEEQDEDPIVFAEAPEAEEAEAVEEEVDESPEEEQEPAAAEETVEEVSGADESSSDDEDFDDEEDEEAWLELRSDLATLAKNDDDEGFTSLTQELMEEVPEPAELIEDLLRLLAAEIISPTSKGGAKSGAGEWGPPAELTVTDEGFARLFMSAGRMHGIRPGDVVGAIAGESGLPGKIIGSIDIYEKFTFLEVQADHAQDVLDSCSQLQIRGNSAQLRPATERGDEAGHDRGGRGGYDRGGSDRGGRGGYDRGGSDRGGRGGYGGDRGYDRERSFEPRDRREGGRDRVQRDHGGPSMDLSRAPEEGMARLFVSIGRNSGVRPGDLVGAITGTTGIPGKALGAIEIKERVSFIEVKKEAESEILGRMSRSEVRGRSVEIKKAVPFSERESEGGHWDDRD